VLTDVATPYPVDALTNLHTLGSSCPDPNTFHGAFDSAATGISNSNHVVGWGDVRSASGTTRGFLRIPIDPNGCEIPEDAVDEADTTTDTTTGDGSTADGDAILGTLGDATGDEETSGTGGTSTPAGLSGVEAVV
jgi:hypothetical protein